MKRKIAILGLAFFATFSFAKKDILGQKAFYRIDKNPNRTSSMIKSGNITATVAKMQETSNGPSYVVDLNYAFSVSFLGNQSGIETVMVEDKYFTEQFLIDLRQTKHYEGPNFKANHLGFADAKNMDGKFYKNCDKVLLYDIKQPPYFILDLFSSLLEVDQNDIQNLKALLHIYPGIPALGAVKMDISGVHSGQSVKAGGDYIP